MSLSAKTLYKLAHDVNGKYLILRNNFGKKNIIKKSCHNITLAITEMSLLCMKGICKKIWPDHSSSVTSVPNMSFQIQDRTALTLKDLPYMKM